MTPKPSSLDVNSLLQGFTRARRTDNHSRRRGAHPCLPPTGHLVSHFETALSFLSHYDTIHTLVLRSPLVVQISGDEYSGFACVPAAPTAAHPTFPSVRSLEFLCRHYRDDLPFFPNVTVLRLHAAVPLRSAGAFRAPLKPWC